MTVPASVQIVLETMGRHDVKALLMGGQACVFYGASEFSRDVDQFVACLPCGFDVADL